MRIVLTVAAILAVAFLAPPAVDMLLSVLRDLRLRADRSGDCRRGTVIFVEPLRAFGVRWGLRSVTAGLRRAGFEGEVVYWRWQQWWRAWLMVPAIVGKRAHQQQARRLARFIHQCRRQYPDRPTYLIGYSSGGFVALRALELLNPAAAVDAAALLAPAVSPGYDLTAAAQRVRGKLVVTSSFLDWAIVGFALVLLGTCDRRHSVSAGMVGLRRAPAADVVQIRWRPGLVRLGHFGGHFSATAPAFVARWVAPAMGIGPAPADPEQPLR